MLDEAGLVVVGRHRDRPCRGDRVGRLRTDLRVDVEPAGGHRRRDGDRAACRAVAARRRVRAVPSDGDVARPRRHRPAGARVGGGARRGRDPVRRRRRTGDGRRAPARGPGAARRRGRRDQPSHGRGAGRRRRPRVPRRDPHGRAVLRTVPVDHRGVPRDRHRPRGRSDPGRPGRALRVRGHPGRPRRRHRAARVLRRRRGDLHGRARRQPAGRRTASPSRWCPARGSGRDLAWELPEPSSPTCCTTPPSSARSSIRPGSARPAP